MPDFQGRTHFFAYVNFRTLENVKKENVGEPLEADLLGNPYKPNIILRGAVQDRITAGMAIIVR